MSLQAFLGFCGHSLLWSEDDGMGYFPVADHEGVYTSAYFEKYRKMSDTGMGAALNGFRADLVDEHLHPIAQILDVGIGDGAFLRVLADRDRLDAKGYDINPTAIEYLNGRGQWGDLYLRKWACVTFWDSLEHIPNPFAAMEQVTHSALVSIPVFKDLKHVLRSKHFRKDEHFWYFTPSGFRQFATRTGFEVLHETHREAELGREDIMTFVLRRIL